MENCISVVANLTDGLAEVVKVIVHKMDGDGRYKVDLWINPFLEICNKDNYGWVDALDKKLLAIEQCVNIDKNQLNGGLHLTQQAMIDIARFYGCEGRRIVVKF